MARQVNNEDAAALLGELFPLAEDDHRKNVKPNLPPGIVAQTDIIFGSMTRAYRQALVGCAIARILDPEVDIRLPATELGENAFSGRTLDEKVVAPFLRDRAIPVSASTPYLSALRGGARFVPGGQPRIQRDKKGFAALVEIVTYLHDSESQAVKQYLRYLLRRFVHLRESADISLKRIGKPNLDQLTLLIDGLLDVKSGGRFPAFLATAMFQTLSECFDLGWVVEFQEINVADKAIGAAGDIEIRKDDVLILAVEITERPIDQNRVTLTFDQKISQSGINDYLFISTACPEPDAITAARKFTAVGHEMNFVPLRDWLRHNLATIGQKCRALFQAKMIQLLKEQDVSADLKVAWNTKMDAAIGVG